MAITCELCLKSACFYLSLTCPGGLELLSFSLPWLLCSFGVDENGLLFEQKWCGGDATAVFFYRSSIMIRIVGNSLPISIWKRPTFVSLISCFGASRLWRSQVKANRSARKQSLKKAEKKNPDAGQEFSVGLWSAWKRLEVKTWK